ncbi:MAG: hypothetical protein Q8P05_06310 [Candidatus Diapherotrites archaeon]|nr:hypothetical protein [Candidatus Diapherotrites archaeon]
MEDLHSKKKEKPVTIEVLMEGPGGELYFQPVEATPDHLEDLIKATTNSMIKHNLAKQLERLRKDHGEEDTH